jgi:regulator of replication initiation timing
MFDKEHEQQKKSKLLIDEIKRLEDLAAAHAAAAAERDALAQELERLRAELERLRAELERLRAENERLRARPQADASAHAGLENDLRAARGDNRALQETVTRLRAQIAGMTSDLQDALKQTAADTTQLKKTIAANVQKEIAASRLLAHMTATPPNYPAVARAVAAAPRGPKKAYAPHALFLILEAMGGTWSLWRAHEAKLSALRARPPSEATKKAMAAAEHKQALLFQCVMYDLTMWHSIANDKRTRYTSHHVAQFIADFGLVNEDVPSAAAEASSDDDDPPLPAAPTRAEREARAAAANAAADAAAAAQKAERDAVFGD